MSHDFERLERKMDLIIRLLILSINQGEQTAMSVKDQLQAILDEVHAESTTDASVGALITNLQNNAADPAQLQAILDGMKANQAAVTSALLSNGSGAAPVVTVTPPATPPADTGATGAVDQTQQPAPATA